MSAENLCRPIDPLHLQAAVYIKLYTQENYTLTIRPFCVATDMEVLYGWLEQQTGIPFWKKDSPRQELLQSYIDILNSAYSQSLLCLLDDRPVCLADISRAPYNEIFMYLEAGNNDYSFWPVMSPYVTVRNAYINIVKAYLEYFFSVNGPERVVTYQPAYDEWSNHLLKNAGFEYLDTKQLISGVSHLYECRKKEGHK